MCSRPRRWCRRRSGPRASRTPATCTASPPRPRSGAAALAGCCGSRERQVHAWLQRAFLETLRGAEGRRGSAHCARVQEALRVWARALLPAFPRPPCPHAPSHLSETQVQPQEGRVQPQEAGSQKCWSRGPPAGRVLQAVAHGRSAPRSARRRGSDAERISALLASPGSGQGPGGPGGPCHCHTGPDGTEGGSDLSKPRASAAELHCALKAR
jgi:hypothetical protein